MRKLDRDGIMISEYFHSFTFPRCCHQLHDEMKITCCITFELYPIKFDFHAQIENSPQISLKRNWQFVTLKYENAKIVLARIESCGLFTWDTQ